jgi:response regulator RpfG family c-di-GMP phosphodiesterase
MSAQRSVPSVEGRRIVVCDYNALLLSVTGLLRMTGYCVFQAHDGYAAQELCVELPRIDLLILNTHGTGIDNGDLVRGLRAVKPGFPVLHIGLSAVAGLPADVPTIVEGFGPEALLQAVHTLLHPGPVLRVAS